MKKIEEKVPIHSLTIYESQVNLPSVMIVERTGTSGLYWEPKVTHRVQENCEIIYVLKGAGRITVDERWFDAMPHQIFFIPPGVPLDIQSQDKDKLDLLYAHFTLDQNLHSRRLNGAPPYILQEVENYNEESYLSMLVLPDEILLPQDNPVIRYLQTALNLNESKPRGYYQETRILLLGALHQLSTAFLAAISPRIAIPRGKMASLANRIHEYVTAHITDFNGMDDLSAELGMNCQYLSRVFKKAYGENIVSFVNRMRIDIAKKHLASTDARVPDIAKASGFSTTSHFQRVFKTEVGFSPIEFRARLAEQRTPTIGFTSLFEQLPHSDRTPEVTKRKNEPGRRNREQKRWTV